MKINHKFRSLIPALSHEEFNQLEASLKADGCRDSLVLWNETLLDGHNRYDICQKHGIEFNTVSISLPDENAAKAWIIRNQFGRRNITLAARCELAAKLAEALKPMAELSYKSNVGRPSKSSPKLAAISKVDTRAQAAKEAGVSHGSLSAYRYVKENAEPEELDELMRNPNAKLHKVVKEVRERKSIESRKSKRNQAAKDAKLDCRIIVGDFRKHSDKIPNGSLSLIFTDPPYDRKSSEMLTDLAKFAEEKLADGGSLLCYVGQTQLPSAMDALRSHLRYWWTIACVHAGRSTIMREYGINAGWKPVLWFVKEMRDINTEMVKDVMSGGEEKLYHDWQQSQSEAEYWIEKLCPPNGIVCDPFIGGGTTGIAAKKLDRKWIGFEIDGDTAKVASNRINE